MRNNSKAVSDHVKGLTILYPSVKNILSLNDLPSRITWSLTGSIASPGGEEINTINVSTDTENHLNPLMLQEDTSANMTQKWEEQSDAEAIINQLDISARNKRIMKLIFIDNLTQEEAANIIGVSNARISQLLKECKKEAKEYYMKGTTHAD